MTMRRKRKAAKAAREAIRLTLQTISEKHRRPVRKHTITHVKRINSMVPEQEDVVVTSTELQSSRLPIQASPKHPKQSDNNNEIGNSPSGLVDDPVYDQLKQLPDKLLVQLPCGVIRDAAERLKNVNYSALAGFIIFRTDLHPVTHLHITGGTFFGRKKKEEINLS
ncbi:hypothetical protein LOAG_00663 [Loa loa]|nr:hypothetical protein LOAG_00663 [Loa loa]EFO27827.1 hypothetical protein LOAG_00663 [Loa loa]